MPESRPIITLQFGTYANFVGAHFWNFQDELFLYEKQTDKPSEFNGDTLYREGRNEKGESTFTPRALMFDVRSELGTLKQTGFLYQNTQPSPDDNLIWNAPISRHEEAPYPKNEFLEFLEEEEQEEKEKSTFDKNRGKIQKNTNVDEDGNNLILPEIPPHPFNLDSHVQFWSDFFKVHVHPKTIQTLPLWAVEQSSFDIFHAGRDRRLLGNDFFEKSFDNFRHFAEECDVLHGVQTIVDLDSGFSGVACEFLTQVREECPNIPLVCVTLHDRVFSQAYLNTNPFHSLNVAFALPILSDLSSVVIPFDDFAASQISPHLVVQMNSPYSTSAILASGLETFSSPYRSNRSMIDFVRYFQFSGSNQFAHCDLAFPISNPNLTPTELWELLKPNADGKIEFFKPLLGEVPNRSTFCHTEQSMFRGLSKSTFESVARNLPSTAICQYNMYQTPIPIPLSFPSLFRSNFGDDGVVNGRAHRDLAFGHSRISKCMAASRLAVSDELFPFLNTIQRNFSKRQVSQTFRFIDNYGLHNDDFLELDSKLLTIVDSYSPSR